MATRKSPKHREQKRVVAPFDPSAPVHRQQDRDDFIAGEEADHLLLSNFFCRRSIYQDVSEGGFLAFVCSSVTGLGAAQAAVA